MLINLLYININLSFSHTRYTIKQEERLLFPSPANIYASSAKTGAVQEQCGLQSKTTKNRQANGPGASTIRGVSCHKRGAKGLILGKVLATLMCPGPEP